MSQSRSMNRRTALSMMGSAPLAGIVSGISAAQHTGAPPDQPHELTPDGADMGSLFPDIERLVSRNQYPYSFLPNRFRSAEEYRKAGRDVVLDALGGWVVSDISDTTYGPSVMSTLPAGCSRSDLAVLSACRPPTKTLTPAAFISSLSASISRPICGYRKLRIENAGFRSVREINPVNKFSRA